MLWFFVALGLGLAAGGDLTGSDAVFDAGIEEARARGRWDLVADAVIARTRFGLASSVPEAVIEVAGIDEVLDHLVDLVENRTAARGD
jgi:hypothetical protein